MKKCVLRKKYIVSVAALLVIVFCFSGCNLDITVERRNGGKADSEDSSVAEKSDDSKSNGIDAALEEYILTLDSDFDGLTDYDEEHVYNTDPQNRDTDGDGLSDSDEIELKLNPLKKDTDGDGVLDGNGKIQQTKTEEIVCEEKPLVTEVEVSTRCTGNIKKCMDVLNAYKINVFVSDTVGLIAAPIEVKTESQFDDITLTFKLDKTKLGKLQLNDNDIGVLWYNEGNIRFILLDLTIDEKNSTVSVTSDNLGYFMLVDKVEWLNCWGKDAKYTIDQNNG